jgi:hypothetical protein
MFPDKIQIATEASIFYATADRSAHFQAFQNPTRELWLWKQFWMGSIKVQRHLLLGVRSTGEVDNIPSAIENASRR